MKNRMKMILIAAVLCGSMLFSGCSVNVKQTVNRLLDRGSKQAEQLTGTVPADKEPALNIDDELEVPAFSAELTGSISVVQGTPLKLETSASVGDGGTIAYQWYKNNVNSNGGGTLIAGATDPVYTVDTEEAQTVFYYVVATNEHGDSINMAASGVYQVTVWPAGEWTENDTGFQYLMEDGTFPADTHLVIDDTLFIINADGYRTNDGIAPLETMKGDATDNELIQAEADQKAEEEKAAKEKAEAEKKAAEKKKKAAEKKKKAAEEAAAAEQAASDAAASEQSAE